MKWKGAGRRGEIFSEDGDYICIVQTVRVDSIKIEPWPEGKENFRLILNAPVLLEALEAIRDMTKPRLRSHIADIPATCAEWKAIRDHAIAAIAAVKGEDNEDVENHNNELA